MSTTAQSLPYKRMAAVAALVVLGACSRGSSTEKLLADAQNLQGKGDLKGAVIQLKNALQQTPDNAEVRYRLGALYLVTGDAPSAEKELRRALELGYKADTAMPLLGRSLLLQGKYDKVLSDIRVAASGAAETTPWVLALHGQAQAGLRHPDMARKSYEAALKAQPEFPDALVGLARMAAMQHDFKGAMAYVDRALKVRPDDPDAMLIRADVLSVQGDADAALAAYGSLLEKHPHNTAARLSRASAALNANRMQDAQADIDAVRKAEPNNLMGQYMQAMALFRRNEMKGALEAVQGVLKAAPGHPPSLVLAGAIENAEGMLEQSETHLRAFLEKSPDNVYARKVLASTLLKNRQPHRALEVLSPALRVAPEDPGVLSLAGEAYAQSNDLERAAQYLEKAGKADPTNVNLRTGIALNRLAAGESDRAIADLEAASKMDKDKFQADVLLVVSHLSRKEYPQALAAVDALEKKQPSNPLTWNLRGTAQAATKDTDAARRSFEQALKLDANYFPAILNLARLDLAGNDPQAARKRFEAILDRDHSNLQAMLALAGLANSRGQAAEAIDWLQKARKENPKAPQPAVELARLHLQRGEYPQAIAVAREALSTNVDDPALLEVEGQSQMASGDAGAAIATFNRLVTVQSGSPQALSQLASAQLASNNTAAASVTLRKALELNPDYLDAKVALAGIASRAGRFDEADRLVQEVKTRYPKSGVGAELEGEVLMAQGKAAQAAKAYQAALALSPGGGLAVKLHGAQTRAGDASAANAGLSRWIEGHPEDVGARIYFADAYLKQGAWAKAAEQYEATLKRQPQNLLVLNNLAWTLQQLKDPRAVEFAEQAYRQKPDSAAVAETLGSILIDQGKTARGLELLQSAAKLAPAAPEIRFSLARGLARTGDKAGARAELERLLSSGDKFPQVAEARALLKEVQN